jgi:RHS repeat-associated protein
VAQRFRIRYHADSVLRLDSVTVATSASGSVPFVPRHYTYDPGSGVLTQLQLMTGTGYTTSFSYNNELNLIGVTYPGTGGLTNPGPLGDSLTSIHTPYRVQFTNSTLDNPLNQKFGFDSVGRLNNSIPVNTVLSVWANAQYRYDGLGRLSSVRDTNISGAVCPADTTFGFQCTAAPRAGDTLTYDAASNLTGGTLSGVMVTSLYKNGNRDSTLRGVAHTFDFDGNLTVSGSRQFKWGVEGYLDSVVAGTVTLQYQYDAAGHPVKRLRNGTLDRLFLWDGDQLLAELDATGKQRIGEYVSMGPDDPFALIQGATSLASISYYLHDVSGNVLGVFRSDSNHTQSVREQYTYDDLGLPTAVVDSGLANRMNWKGMVYEGDSTRLYYARARWYDPQQGRFMSEDPTGLSGGLNQYAFAGGDYINGRDPSGTCGPGGGGNTGEIGDEPADFCDSWGWYTGNWGSLIVTFFGTPLGLSLEQIDQSIAPFGPEPAFSCSSDGASCLQEALGYLAANPLSDAPLTTFGIQTDLFNYCQAGHVDIPNGTYAEGEISLPNLLNTDFSFYRGTVSLDREGHLQHYDLPEGPATFAHYTGSARMKPLFRKGPYENYNLSGDVNCSSERGIFNATPAP